MYRPFGCERQETWGLRSASLDPLGLLPLRQALAAVDARLHPVELGAGSSRGGRGARRGGCRTRCRAAPGTGRAPRSPSAISSACRRRSSASARARRRPQACGRRSRGTRSRARSPRERHRLDRLVPVGPRRVAVEVAADVRELDERRRLAPERRLAQLGRAERDPERAVDALLVRRVRQRLERGDVLRRAGRADELGAELAAGSATTSSTGTPSTVTPYARRSARSSTETIAGSDSKPSSTGVGVVRPGRRPRTARSSRGSGAGRRPGCRRAARRSPRGGGAPGGAACPRGGRGSSSRDRARRAASPPSPGRSPAPPAGGRRRRPRGARRPCGRRASARSAPPLRAPIPR